MALKPEEMVVLRGEMETFVEAQLVAFGNRLIHAHIKKHHPLLWKWICFKAHTKTLLDLLRSTNPAAKKHIKQAIKDFFVSEEGR